MSNTKEDIFVQTIMPNIERKSVYVDSVQMHEGNPLFSWLEINPTELCNRLCTFCPRVEPDEYPNQNLNMSVDLAKKIANELNELFFRRMLIQQAMCLQKVEDMMVSENNQIAIDRL